MSDGLRNKVLSFLIICLLTVFIVSCASLRRDLHLEGAREKMELDLLKLERLIIPLEAMGGTEARRQQDVVLEARLLIGEMEKNSYADNDYSGKLTAWSGRLAILEGRYSEARRLYREAITASPWNITSTVLGILIEGDPSKRLELIERELVLADSNSPSSGYGELQIEKARSLLELRRFVEAAGAFDTAFASGIDGIYRESYQWERDRAWELRNTGGFSGNFEILERGGLSWRDCISLAKNETQLLRFLTAGRDTSETELMNTLLDRGFIPYTQDININDWPRTRPRIEDIVFRSGAAWFIWRLNAEARSDRSLLTRYSARYATGSSPRSPVADIPPLSPFFDSILGCVETELLSLPDGRNFMPENPIRAAELLAILKKIDTN